MAKEKVSEDPRDSFLKASIEEAQKKFGDKRAYIIPEHEARTFGIRLNNLALMYLTDSNIWPLSRFTFTHGVEQSGKSAFFYWLCKLYIDNGGLATIVSTEAKDSPSLMKSILQEASEKTDYRVALTAQEWQWNISKVVERYRKTFGEPKLKGEYMEYKGDGFPLIIGVDSLQGVIDKEEKQKSLKQGFADARGYPVTALTNTKYLQAIGGELVGFPITLHFVNHTKPELDEQKKKPTRAAGATHMRFAGSLDLWFTRIGQIKPTQGRPWHGFLVRIEVNKTSLGSGQRRIAVQMCWVPDKKAPGGQRTWWNWDLATAELLRDIKASVAKHPIFDVLEGFTENSKRYSCKKLGLIGVEGHEIGAAINSDEALLSECVRILDIHEYQTYAPGVM